MGRRAVRGGGVAGRCRDDPQALRTLLDALSGWTSSRVSPALTRVAVLWGWGTRTRGRRSPALSCPASIRLKPSSRRWAAGPTVPQPLAALGGGLPGAAVPAREPWQDAYAVALVSLVGDDAPDRFRLVQAAEVAARRVTAGHPDDPDVLAWLLLGD